MLSKLIKYDIRSTWRDFAGVYMSILLGVIIAPLLFNHVDTAITDMLGSFLITSIVIATIVIMIVNLFKIFNTNVFSKQGYLTMTLPVTSQQIVFSKLIVSMMWIICTGIVSVIGVFIFFMILNPLPYASLAAAIEKLAWFLNSQGYLAVALIILSIIASAVKEIAKLFLACSIAHLKQLNRFRIPLAILSYFALSWLETLIIQAIGEMLNFIPYTEEMIQQLNKITNLNGFQDFIGLFNGMLVAGILYALLLSFAFSIGTVWVLNHKLDLE